MKDPRLWQVKQSVQKRDFVSKAKQKSALEKVNPQGGTLAVPKPSLV
jgi:hypothetical protein